MAGYNDIRQFILTKHDAHQNHRTGKISDKVTDPEGRGCTGTGGREKGEGEVRKWGRREKNGEGESEKKKKREREKGEKGEGEKREGERRKRPAVPPPEAIRRLDQIA